MGLTVQFLKIFSRTVIGQTVGRMPDPRPARTRQRLLKAGHELIAEKGVANLRIAELTEQAGVALGSFQNHFASKDELVEAVAREAIETLAAEIVDAPGALDEEPAVVAIRALRRFVRLAYTEPEFCRLLVNLSRGEELFVEATRPFAETALKRAAEDGAFTIEDLDVAVTSITAGALGVIRRILDGHLGDDADARLAHMTLLALGVGAQDARRIVSSPP
jgi:AcrR family transcriptional regulator